MKQHLNNCFPLLVVKNLRRTVEWYKTKLGFKADFVDYKTWDYASLKKEAITLMFHGEKALEDKRYAASVRRLAKRGTGIILYMEVPDVNRYHASLKRKRVKVVWPLKDQPWGARTFTVADPDGYLLTFMTSKENPHGCEEE